MQLILKFYLTKLFKKKKKKSYNNMKNNKKFKKNQNKLIINRFTKKKKICILELKTQCPHKIKVFFFFFSKEIMSL